VDGKRPDLSQQIKAFVQRMRREKLDYIFSRERPAGRLRLQKGFEDRGIGHSEMAHLREGVKTKHGIE
jgi:hypothetical protein